MSEPETVDINNLKNEINDLLVKFNTLTDEAQEKIKVDFQKKMESVNGNELEKLKIELTTTIKALEKAQVATVEEPVATVKAPEANAAPVAEANAPVVEAQAQAQEGGSRRRKSKKSKGRKTKKGKKRKTRRKTIGKCKKSRK